MAQWWADHLDVLRKGAEVVPMRAVSYRRVGIPPLLLLPHCDLISANMVNRILTQSRHWFLVLAGQ